VIINTFCKGRTIKATKIFAIPALIKRWANTLQEGKVYAKETGGRCIVL
jgi:hypothetical protein